jgi:LacI family transcriptional regulator
MYTQQVRISKTLREQPLVLLNCLARGKAVPAVIPDEREAGKTAVRELLEHGHRDQIVIVGEKAPHVLAGAERLAGVQEVLQAEGTELADSISCLWWPEYAFSAVLDYLQAGNRPSAFICLNDRIAMGVYQAGLQLGLSVPQDFSVVSFDDSDLASWLRPQLTSVAIPHFELGRRAVELLLTPDRPNDVIRIPMPLRVRVSVGPPPVRRRRRARTGT